MPSKAEKKEERKQEEKKEARQIAERMETKGKSEAQIAQRIENKTHLNAAVAANIASRATSPPPPSSTSNIKNITVGPKINASEYQQLLDKGLTAAQIKEKAKDKDIKFGPNAKDLLKAGLNPANSSSGVETETETETEDGNQIPFSIYSLFPDVLSNQANVKAEEIRRAGAFERLKYEVDNQIPLAQAEAQGKIDLQKIVNAGYKNIANIERGTEMVRNVTSMFNF